MMKKASTHLLIPLLAALALSAAASSASAQSREFMRGYEQGFRDGVASVQGGAGTGGPPFFPPANPGWRPGRLVILEAWFGLRHGPSCDARPTVQAIVNGRGVNEVYASTRLCGDPAPNRPKQLTVTFSCDNRPAVSRTVNEGQFLRFPC
jgi:hypothetical protein